MARDDQYEMLRPNRDCPSPVSALALSVVSVLNAKQAEEHRGEARPFVSSILAKRVNSRASFDATEVLAELRAFRLGDEAIINAYIPAVARHVGERWVENDLGFAEVTIASVRLQSLLTEVAYGNSSGATINVDPLNVLFVTCEHEQHTLGAFVAAAQLRRRGITVEVSCGEPAAELVDRIIKGSFDAVLFSTSRWAALETISKMIKQIRRKKKSPPVFVVGGIILDYIGNVQRVTGADLVTADVDAVVAFCEQKSEKAYESPARAMR